MSKRCVFIVAGVLMFLILLFPPGFEFVGPNELNPVGPHFSLIGTHDRTNHELLVAEFILLVIATGVALRFTSSDEE